MFTNWPNHNLSRRRPTDGSAILALFSQASVPWTRGVGGRGTRGSRSVARTVARTWSGPRDRASPYGARVRANVPSLESRRSFCARTRCARARARTELPHRECMGNTVLLVLAGNSRVWNCGYSQSSSLPFGFRLWNSETGSTGDWWICFFIKPCYCCLCNGIRHGLWCGTGEDYRKKKVYWIDTEMTGATY